MKMNRISRIAVTAALVPLVGLATAAPSYADKYEPTGSSPFNFAASNSGAVVQGKINWFKGDRSWRPDIRRGDYAAGSMAQANKKGCVYTQIVWHYLTGSVSWPPSGSSGATGDGWYQKCGGPGTQISLAGQSHAQATLTNSCVSVGWSADSKSPRSYQSSHCYQVPGVVG
jgi:hypothetical protein